MRILLSASTAKSDELQTGWVSKNMATIENLDPSLLTAMAHERFHGCLLSQELKILEENSRLASDIRVTQNGEREPVRAEFVIWLVTDQNVAKLLSRFGVRVDDAIIEEKLDLTRCQVIKSLRFNNCLFAADILFSNSEFSQLEIWSCIAESDFKADKITIHANLHLHKRESTMEATGLVCRGNMSMIGARIHGNFDACGAHLEGSDFALNLERAVIDGNLYIRNGFVAKGPIKLNSARIGGQIDCSRASIGELACINTKIDGDFKWTNIVDPQRAKLYFLGALVGTIQDDNSSWPCKGSLLVNRMIYKDLVLVDNLQDSQQFVVNRIKWLNLQPSAERAEPQPWIQLSQVVKAKGDKAGARRVIYELRKNEAAKNWLPLRIWKLVFARLEEQPLRIAIPMFLLIIFGSSIYRNAELRAIAPTNRDAYSDWTSNGQFKMAYPSFNPTIYTIENVLPILKLGQDDKWAPDPNYRSESKISSYGFLTRLRWFLILAGWLQGTVLIAALSSRFKNE